VLILIGLVYGSFFGLLGNWLLFRKLVENQRNGFEALRGIGTIFFLRYMIDGISLLTFAFVVKDGLAITAAAISLTIVVKISLFVVYARKGGRFD
jgi:hypothetical protein